MNRNSALVAPVAALLFAAGVAHAETSVNMIVTPTSAIFDSNNVTGVVLDAAPGFPYGSFASNGVAKTDMYFTPESLFGGPVTLGEIESISYWTKTGTMHSVDPRDWYLVIYTKPFVGDVSTPAWYGSRIGSEPYFSISINDPANTWNQWSTDAGDNQLRFFESTQGAPGATFGSYSDPDWASFVGGSSLGTAVPYAEQEILFFSAQTGSAWAAGFTGQLDGLRIELTDGSVANVNFEPFLVPTNKDACKKNGWTALFRANGSTFKNQGDCVSYTNTGR